MIKILQAFTVAVALTSFAPPLKADEEAARLAAAKDLVARIHVEATMKQVLPSMFVQIRNMLVQQNPKIAKDLDEILPRVMEKFFTRLDEIKDPIAAIYARRLSEAELRQVIAFYDTPTGAKLVTMQPDIARESMELGGRWGARIAGEAVEDMKAELRKRGHSI